MSDIGPSEEVLYHEITVRATALVDILRHAQMRMQSSVLNAVRSMQPLILEMTVLRLMVEVETTNLIAEAEQGAPWVDRLLLGR